MIYESFVKRGTDFVLSSLALFFLLPLIFTAAILVKLSSPGPIFFTQERVGRNGHRFNIYKVRTMSVDNGRGISQTLNSDPDVFPVGKILRRFKLDELPQIYNVVKGDMSIVGPRPCLEQTAKEMPIWARQRFSFRPGLTGLAQVNGNVSLSWEERWRYDIDYVDNCSFNLDLKILAKTFLVVFRGEEYFRRRP